MKTSIAFAIMISFMCSSFVQTKNKTVQQICGDDAKAEIEMVNSRIENFYENEKVDSLINLYDAKCTYVPEYKATIYGKDELKKFYADWFNAVDMGAYHKKIYQVENIGDHILEIGNFSLHYSTKLKMRNEYSGKYMVMWNRNADGKLKIVAEAFGAAKFVNPEDMPYAAVDVKDLMPLEKNILSNKIESEMEEIDKGVVKAVVDGDGEARAKEFTEDGIYLPHFDPMQIGMEMIRPYMLKTYAPGRIAFVKNIYREIFNIGTFVFLNGHFKVQLSKTNGGGYFEGNMLNLMKRGKDGKLLMYRQLAHN